MRVQALAGQGICLPVGSTPEVWVHVPGHRSNLKNFIE